MMKQTKVVTYETPRQYEQGLRKMERDGWTADTVFTVNDRPLYGVFPYGFLRRSHIVVTFTREVIDAPAYMSFLDAWRAGWAKGTRERQARHDQFWGTRKNSHV